MKQLYFAYGSNLLLTQMKSRCPLSVPVERAILRDYELVYKDNGRGRGVASIEYKKGSKVYGAIYELTDKCEKTLDKFEGVPRVYTKQFVTVESRSGEIECLTYCMLPHFKLSMPKLDYFMKIYNGYDDWFLSRKHLTKNIKEFKKQFTI